jgi:hypothetical protein
LSDDEVEFGQTAVDRRRKRVTDAVTDKSRIGIQLHTINGQFRRADRGRRLDVGNSPNEFRARWRKAVFTGRGSRLKEYNSESTRLE